MPLSIQTVLSGYPEIAKPLVEPLDLGNAGGLSGSRFWRYRSRLGELVLKRWPDPGPTPDELRRKHAWLRLASSLGFVPVPITARSGGSFVEQGGYLWEVDPWMPGNPALANPADDKQVEAAFAALARFHAILANDSRNEPSPALISRLAEIRQWQARDLDLVQASLASPPIDTTQQLVKCWVDLARIQAPRINLLLDRFSRLPVRLQPCLKDARGEHWLFDGSVLKGLVDFGAMDIENVAADLSRLTTDWFNDDLIRREIALKAYSAMRPLDSSDLELIDVFDQSADLLLGGHWVRWSLLESRVFEDSQSVVRGLTKGVERLSRLAVTTQAWRS